MRHVAHETATLLPPERSLRVEFGTVPQLDSTIVLEIEVADTTLTGALGLRLNGRPVAATKNGVPRLTDGTGAVLESITSDRGWLSWPGWDRTTSGTATLRLDVTD